MNIDISQRWVIEKLFGMLAPRPRPVCSCEVPDYAEDLFDRSEFRYRCGTCRGYIDLVWIEEGIFPPPPNSVRYFCHGSTDEK